MVTTSNVQVSQSAVWAIAEQQHDRVTHEQLVGLGMTESMIRHRLRVGRLHAVARCVYAISRPRGTLRERWMTDALRCGEGSGVGFGAAFALWGLGREFLRVTEVCVPAHRRPRPAGVRVHRRALVLPAELRRADLIPVTSPELTLIDNAIALGPHRLEAAINDADGRGLTNPAKILALADRHPKLKGAGLVRAVLEPDTFRFTGSELERVFFRLLLAAGLPLPDTQVRTDSGRVDFAWSAFPLIVEADSLRHHRTASQQAKDARRDQEHLARGITTIRFTHAQVHHEPDHVVTTLLAVLERLRG